MPLAHEKSAADGASRRRSANDRALTDSCQSSRKDYMKLKIVSLLQPGHCVTDADAGLPDVENQQAAWPVRVLSDVARLGPDAGRPS